MHGCRAEQPVWCTDASHSALAWRTDTGYWVPASRTYATQRALAGRTDADAEPGTSLHPVSDKGMGTMFPIPGQFSLSPASGLSRCGTMLIPLRSGLGVTCRPPPTGAYMEREQTSGRPQHPPPAPQSLGVCARPTAGVGRTFVCISFGDPTPTNPKWPCPRGPFQHKVPKPMFTSVYIYLVSTLPVFENCVKAEPQRMLC